MQMKPLQQYFHKVTVYLVRNSNIWVCEWNPVVRVTNQMKPLQQYFHMVLFI